MLLSRKLDDKEIQLKNQSQIFFQISGAGHEAMLVAAGMALKPGYDWFFPYYRDRALCLQLGMTPLRDAARGGRRQGRSRVRRPPDAVALGPPDAQHRVAARAPTGTQVLHAVGAAEAGVIYSRVPQIPDRASRYHDDEITYVSLGEGATSEGEFWEALNVACTKHLPVLFLVEDNGYAISVPVEVQTAGGDISRLVRGFPGLHVDSIDGTDFFDSLRAMREAAAYVRARKGPALVHARVIRPYSHSLSDDEKLYKPPAEREARSAPRSDRAILGVPEERTAGHRRRAGRDGGRRRTRGQRGRRRQRSARSETARSPVPSSGSIRPMSIPRQPRSTRRRSPKASPTRWSRRSTGRSTTRWRAIPRIVVFGEDVADASRERSAADSSRAKAASSRLTHGLQRLYGDDRVFNSPLAEANIVGRGVGMATRKLKPVVEIQFFDYIWPAMMQIRDEMSMLRYRSGNTWSCPMVIRVPIGGYLRGGGPYHSQSGESIFAHCPGVRIAYPSTAVDAAGLLRTAIRCDDPVMFLEHKHLYRQTYNKGEYPGKDFMIPFGTRGCATRRRPTSSSSRGARWCSDRCVAAQQAEKDRHQRRRPRPADDRAVRLGSDRRRM